MDLGDLKTFEAVARNGGMSAAARVLNTVQSNVTTRIRSLEDQLGVPLFDRHSRGVTLTEAGARLLPYAARARSLVDEAARAVTDPGAPAGTLTVGSLETTAAMRLSGALVTFASRWPEVDLVLRTGTTREMIEAVRRGEVEGAFVCAPPEGDPLLDGLEAADVFHEELILLTAPRFTSPEAALAAPEPKIAVLRAGCSYRQRLEEVLASRGVAGLRVLEFGTIDSLIAATAAGIGLTLLPAGMTGPEVSAGVLAAHRLAPAEARVTTTFIRRPDAFISSALRAFMETVQETNAG